MNVYLKASLVSLLAGLIFVAGFLYWKKEAFSTAAEAEILSMEKMETQGLPNFKAVDVQGQSFELKQVLGKVVILNFWASWCAPCVEEFPSMIRLVEEMKGDVVLVAISGDNSKEDMQRFLSHLKGWDNPSIHVIWDENQSFVQQYGVERLPESFLADRNQKLVKKIVGSINWFTPESVQYLREVYQK